jgi:quercetin dioxygenase-like cupin family protein
MKTAKLHDMINGWFIGNFEPSLCKTDAVEVAVKTYKKGDYDKKHYHKVATEYTVIVYGRAIMNGVEYGAGDIVVMEPGEVTDFEALDENTIDIVIKIPSVKEDKYTITHYKQ